MSDKDLYRAEMARSYLPDATPKVTDKIFDMAWERGHASGIAEVEMEYADLADLVAAAGGDSIRGAVGSLADQWVGTKGGVLAAKVAREHEPRHMACSCGAQIGDSIDRHWHTINAAIDEAGQSLRAALGKA